MTEQKKNKRTRRRFLADMLFLGGGISAAGLLAQSQIFDGDEAHPQVMGEMVMPDDIKATPCEVPPDQADAPLPGSPLPPKLEGDYAAPNPPVTGGKPVAPMSVSPPQVEGRPALP